MLHGISCLFPPPSVTGHNGGNPIALKKLLQQEGLWAYNKEILGWDFNGKSYTFQLTKKKANTIINLIKHTIKLYSCDLQSFQELAGKLQDASFGIPNGKGLFSPINQVLANDP